MDDARLQRHIIDVIKEEQIKLGYRREAIRLYYPLGTLNRLLADSEDGADIAPDAPSMQKLLETSFRTRTEGTLGKIEISHQGERFCLIIPPEGAAYVHAHTDDNEFLTGFIRLIEKHGCTISELADYCRGYSEHVKLQKICDGEVDYVLYFEDGIPDGYRYCITDEGCHLIYHRFMPEDFRELYPEIADV